MKIILLGPPGSGKGTQAENIRGRLRIPSISTGAILREAIKQETETGLRAKEFIDAGKLVPDDAVIEIIRERLADEDCAGGFIMDGFPRTVAQAEGLDASGVKIDICLSIEVPDDEIERRLTGRRICSDCGLSYHIIYNAPKRENVCDGCSGELSVRGDDMPETVRARLKVYHESTEPLLGYYERKGILKTVVSDEEVAVTTRRVNEALGIS